MGQKGNLPIEDMRGPDGYEDTNINPEKVAKKISDILTIGRADKVLEVGCEAGMLAQYLDCDYMGIDYSKSLVKKHIWILKNSVLHGHANNLMFKAKSFEKK